MQPFSVLDRLTALFQVGLETGVANIERVDALRLRGLLGRLFCTTIICAAHGSIQFYADARTQLRYLLTRPFDPNSVDIFGVEGHFQRPALKAG